MKWPARVGLGIASLCVFGLAGCAAVVAGAAAGMLASRPSQVASAGTTTVQTPTAGDSIDQAADSAGAALARTIKENVPQSVRGVPVGTPKVVTAPVTVKPGMTPAAKPATTVAAPSKVVPAGPTVIPQTERIHDDINTEGASR